MERRGTDILSGRGDVEFSSDAQAEAHEEHKRLTAKDKARRKLTQVPNTGHPEDELIAKLDAERASLSSGEVDEGPSDDHEMLMGRAKIADEKEPSKLEDDEMLKRGDKYATDKASLDANTQRNRNIPPRREDIYDPSLAQNRYPSSEQKSQDSQIRKRRKLKHK